MESMLKIFNLLTFVTQIILHVRMFKSVGLQKNLGKTKAMVCTPGFIWGQQGESEYKKRATGEAANVLERNRNMVIFKECEVMLEESSLRHRIERTHSIVLTQNRGEEVSGRGPET